MNLEDIFRPRARVNIFTSERVGNPRCVAEVEEFRADGLTLVFEPDDLRESEIGQGDAIQLGFGVVELGMHYTCETTVRSTDGPRVVCGSLAPPQKRPRRSHARAPLDWRCSLEITDPGGVRSFAGVTVNVSASGALLKLDHEPGRALTGDGAPARLRLDPPGREPLLCTAEVVRLGAPGVPVRARPLIAVRFIDLPEASETKLQLMVLRAIARRYLRCRASVPCRLVLEGQAGGAVLDGRSENLSGSGLLLELPAPPAVRLERGQRGALRVDLAGVEVAVELAEVTRVEARATGVALAVRYVHIGRDQRSAIIEYVMERVRDV